MTAAALLAKDGLVEGKDYQTVLIDGFDPKVHIELPSIVAFPGWKSNEPGQLDAEAAAIILRQYLVLSSFLSTPTVPP